MQPEDKDATENSLQVEHIKTSLERLQERLHQIYQENIRLQKQKASQLSEIKAQIANIQCQIDRLSYQLTTAASSADLREDEKTVKDYLIAEFNALHERWKHTDSRIESSIKFYLTISTIITSAAVFLFQYQSSKQIAIPASLSIAVASFMLALAGFFLTSRARSSAINKAKYLYSINLIRGYFIEKNSEIAPHLEMLMSDRKISSTENVKVPDLRVMSKSAVLVGTVNILSSFVFGIGTASFVHFFSPNISSLVKLLVGLFSGATALLAISIFLRGMLQKALKNHRASLNKQRFR